MSSAHRPPRFHLVLAGILVVLFMLQSFLASLQKSPVFDEPPHIASGLSYLETRVFHGNLQHPPLLKEISAAFLSAAGIHWPKNESADALIRGGPQSNNLEWPIGNYIIHEAGPDRVLFWGRLPFILLGGLLGFLIYWWGREMVGSTAALGALFLYAFDPTIIAHSALVTTDVGLAVFTVLFLFVLWRYLEMPSRPRLVMSGVALGAVLAAKFSAVFLLPVSGLLMLMAVRWPLAAPALAKTEEPEKRFDKAGPNSPCPCGSGRKFKKCHGAPGIKQPGSALQGKLFATAGAFAVMCVIAAVVIQVLYLFQSDPFLYITGLKKVNADHVAGYGAYLHGDLSKRFYTYFAAAYFLKEPLASIALCLGGVVLWWRNRSIPVMKKWFLLLPPAVFFLAPTFLADDMGIRYIIPALPFLYLLGGVALSALLAKTPVWGRYAAAVLCLWLLVDAAGIFPDHLSYFNESACLLESPGNIGFDGGTRCGPLWMDDSNVDWGQGLKQLRTWLQHHANGRTVKLAYFGSFPPEGYGLQLQRLSPNDLFTDPAPGLYAVSAHFVARNPVVGSSVIPASTSWLRRMTPVDIVGHAFYIYDVH